MTSLKTTSCLIFAGCLGWLSQKLEIAYSTLGFNKISIELITNGLGWVALKDHNLFRYKPEICGPILGGGFNPRQTVYRHR